MFYMVLQATMHGLEFIVENKIFSPQSQSPALIGKCHTEVQILVGLSLKRICQLLALTKNFLGASFEVLAPMLLWLSKSAE
jgi:hypothetical protein